MPTTSSIPKGASVLSRSYIQTTRPLYSPSNPVTWLFGNDLSKQFKEITGVNKVGQHVSDGQSFGNKAYQPIQNAPRGFFSTWWWFTFHRKRRNTNARQSNCTNAKIAERLKHFLTSDIKMMRPSGSVAIKWGQETI